MINLPGITDDAVTETPYYGKVPWRLSLRRLFF